MAPPKRTAAAVEANPFEDANANLLAKQKLAAQAHLARASGRRGNAHTHTQNHNTNGHGNGNGLFAQSSGKGLASLADLANMSEAVRTQDGINDATVCLHFRDYLHSIYILQRVLMHLLNSSIGRQNHVHFSCGTDTLSPCKHPHPTRIRPHISYSPRVSG